MPNLKQKPFREKFKNYLFFGLVIIVFLYFLFRIYSYISGPKIIINTPTPYEVIKEDTFILSGNVKNAKNIYINGREINIDENGNFAEKLVAKSPYTLVTIEAIDRYDKKKSEVIEVGKEE